MTSLDLIRMGLKNLWRRKTRTILTVLGVIIGTAAIVVMLSLGIGMNESFKSGLEEMGDLTTIRVRKGYNNQPGVKSKEVKLDKNAIEAFRKIKGVRAVTPVQEYYMRVIAGKEVADISIVGMDVSTMEDFGFKAEEGRILNAADTDAIVFGTYIKDWFYNPKSRRRTWGESKVKLISSKLQMTSDREYGERRSSSSSSEKKKKPKLYKIKGVGVLKETGDEEDWNAYMNIETLRKIIKEESRNRDSNARWYGDQMKDDEYNQAKIRANDINEVKKISAKVKEMGYQPNSLMDMLDEMQKQAAGIQAVLGGIGAISLLVAALGITNTMVMSIYERTREIGVMKVLGANLKDIRRLFLFEAAMIGMLGGLLGIAISKGISTLMNSAGSNFMSGLTGMGGNGDISVIPVWLMAAAVGFATVVGVLAGYYPARRAMKLSALEAIKTE